MFLINVANPWILLLSLFIIICLMYIGKEAKNASVPLTSLIISLILLVMHGIQFLTLSLEYESMGPQLGYCLSIDFVLILLSYISYMWIDEIETKEKSKKSIDDSLKWFWKKV